MNRSTIVLGALAALLGASMCFAAAPQAPLRVEKAVFRADETVVSFGDMIIDQAIDVAEGVTVTLIARGQVRMVDGCRFPGKGIVVARSLAPGEIIPSAPTDPAMSGAFQVRSGMNRLHFDLGTATTLDVRVFDVAGRKVGRLPTRVWPSGTHEVDMRPFGLVRGMYFYRVAAREGARTGTVLVVP